MISEKMKAVMANSSGIRAMFQEGQALARKFGAENVYDFSLGNPNIAAPAEVNQAAARILEQEDSLSVHGYMSNAGYEAVREKIAASLNRRFGTRFSFENIIMTVGAAGGMNVIFKTLLNPGDEVITFAPYFGEYGSYVSNFDGKLVVISPNTVDFQPNVEEFSRKITARTKAVILNSPNNPTGVVYPEETIQAIAGILREKQREFGTDIYIVADEPYRELVYDGDEVPYIPKYYDNTIVGYSFSKSLSLPGERIGYLVIPNEAADFRELVLGAETATRILGFVNAPSLMQKVVAECLEARVDIGFYNQNREMLYNGLREMGFSCIKPAGAFYLFVQSPVADEKAFCEAAKKYNILLVAGSSFACPGYVRIAYCVAPETIRRALPKFRELAGEYGLTGGRT